MLERVVGLVVVAAAGVYLMQALALPYGTTARPGAGFFPTIVAIFVVVILTTRSVPPATMLPTKVWRWSRTFTTSIAP